MNTNSTNKKVIIEQDQRLSESKIWHMQREYFDKEGIQAWVRQVPFYITSNPFIAYTYAKMMLVFMIDWTKNNPKAAGHPFYILELGTGSGRFSYYFVKTLCGLLQRLNREDIKICYVMSDFTKNNIQYWETHPALKPYIEKGVIDFALYNMEEKEPIHLTKKDICLDEKTLVNPLTVFANYIFDTITQDAFSVRDGKLNELLLTLTADKTNMKDGEPINMEEIAVDFNSHEIKEGYYEDAVLNSILEEYKQKLHESSFLFPIGSFRAIQYLKKISKNKLLIISTDKGYNTLESLDYLNNPSILFHGSFSLMVNFHALAQYFKNTGGDAALQQPRKGIKTAAFSSGFKLSDLPQMRLAIDETIDGLSPGDYFILHTRISESFQDCSLPVLAAHMQLTHWDPHMYLKLTNHIISKIEKEDAETIQFLAHNMPKLAENYYYMPQTQCILFDIGIFFHAIKHYQEAANYYEQSKPYIGEQFNLYYNLALCQHHLENNTTALENFKKALEINKDAQEAQQWISYLENQTDL
ncbi:MAG: hypothetical protein H0U75_11265 [Legionella sp.]|nr:hypothetical protein [Legionella sp.]